MSYSGLLFGLPAQVLLPPDVGAPLLAVFDPRVRQWVTVGGNGASGGEPVILGDSDPPDFVLIAGDIVAIGGR